MLRTRALESYLSQAVSKGILGVFVFNNDGQSVAQAGEVASFGSVYGALMLNIWENFDGQVAGAGSQELRSVVLNNTEGSIFVRKVADMYLAVVANQDVPQGMIHSKMNALANHLEQPLNMLSAK